LPVRHQRTGFHFGRIPKLEGLNRLVKDSPVNGTSAPVFRLMSDS
jgi:hypothetical protein